MSCLVIDGFLEFPKVEREKALAATYETIEHNALKYRGIALTEDEESLARISTLLGRKIKEAKVMWRRYLESEQNETYIHSDVQIADFTAILFLNEPEQAYGGTAFWKHRKYGWDSQPTLEQVHAAGLEDTPELWQQIYHDGFDEGKWLMQEMVGMRFNRLFIFEGSRFHSRWPKQAFGTDLKTSRLVKVFFMKVDQ